ncbi:MAG: GTP 3',8-cyclase MoaA, partial [Planctomycetales bacterium]|nr:GTP 3',8-cyclase MoaA [Planctomycetales bacterium]
LRISVTDRCNIRCFYCMPEVGLRFLPRSELLTFEEIARFVHAVVPLGVRKLRLTGGEPLVRTDLAKLVAQLAAIPGVDDLALTTNGILLADHAADLRAAGLQRLNVSLDALSEATFEKIARRPGLAQTLAGIAAAQQAGFEQIRLNTVALRGLTEDEVIPLCEFALAHDLELRFIEFMPLDAEQNWTEVDMLTGAELREIIETRFGPLTPRTRPTASQPAADYWFAAGRGRIGLINPVSEPFCDACDRLRLTAEGQVRNCLFSTREWDARALLRSGAGDDDVRQLVRDCVAAKAAAHGIGQGGFERPERAMYQIGG